MLIQTEYYNATLKAFHLQLLAHPIAQEHLSGQHFRLDGSDADGLVVALPFGELQAHELAQLFAIYDGSRVHQQREEPKFAPPGIYFTTVNDKLLQYKNKIGIVLDEGEGAGLHMPFLFIDQFFFKAKTSPKLLGTISFSLCAIAAHCCGLGFIDLIAAGGAGYHAKHIGYSYWPKVGFDAPLLPSEIEQLKHVPYATTVLDVIAADPQWWVANGSQRLMRFDLSPGSRSWSKLLSYAQEKGLFSNDDQLAPAQGAFG